LDSECSEQDEDCLHCLEQNENQDCRVPENVSKVFDKVCHGDGVTQSNGQSVIDLILGSKLFHLMFMPIIVPVKIIRLTAFLFSFFVLDNWIKHLVETLTSFLLGNDFVSRSKVNLARYHCEFSISKYESGGIVESGSRTDLLSLELDTTLDNPAGVHSVVTLPNTISDAKTFNSNNLSKAVSNHPSVTSRRLSLLPPSSSRRQSLIAGGLTGMGSRKTSLLNIANVISNSDSQNQPSEDEDDDDYEWMDQVEDVPENMSTISKIPDTQNSLLTLYFKQDDQMKLVEIFDVTKTDPACLPLQQSFNMRPNGKCRGRRRHSLAV